MIWPTLRRFLTPLNQLGLLAAGSVGLSAADPIPGANGLELTEFAREPMVRNAVAIAVDEHERVFVTSVVRRQAADLDIRRFREWIEKDVSLTSVEEKQAWFREQLTPANSAEFADRFEDRNGDGLFDFNDLALLNYLYLILLVSCRSTTSFLPNFLFSQTSFVKKFVFSGSLGPANRVWLLNSANL